MWLHVPRCGSSPSVQASECTTLDSERLSMLERFVTSSGKHSPPRSWSLSWKRNAWMKRLSGLTLPLSTLERGAERWIASLQDCPANPTQLPAENSATPTSGHSGKATDQSPNSSESSASVSPPWSSLRTSQLGFLADGFDLSEKNYADWVTSSKVRSSSLRKMLARRISESASGSWPTATVSSEAQTQDNPTPNQTGGTTLPGAVRQWQTPDANLFSSRKQVVKSWPTPAARDEKGTNSEAHVNGGGSEPHGSASELRGIFAPGPLDARWTGIITDSPHLAPALEPGVRVLAHGFAWVVDESRRHQLRAIGNGGVPLCSAVAFGILARRVSQGESVG